MALNYQILPKKNPLDRSEPAKYYLTAKSVGSIDRKFLIEDMVRHTSLTWQEAASALDYLFETIPRLLELGFTIKLGELGYFITTIRSEGADTPEEATVDKIKAKHIRFRPGKALRQAVKDFPVEKRK